MAKLVPGVNDLATLYPEIALEANGWDPRTSFPRSGKKMPWKCKKGHKWIATPDKRVGRGDGCPFCSNHRVLIGFNDLQTKFPAIAKEADGWDPSTILSGSANQMSWRCKEGHTWRTTVDSRTSGGRNCPSCAESGFDPNKPAWFYLMSRPNEQQFGITNNLSQRENTHRRNGWKEDDSTGPHNGYEVEKTEKKLKKWLKENIGVIPGTSENWYTSSIKIKNLRDLKAKSGIKTKIF